MLWLNVLQSRSKHWQKRSRAAKALGNLNSAKAREALENLLCDEDNYVRRSAIQSLGIVGDASSIEKLLPLLNDRDVGSATANALTQLGWEAENHPSALRWAFESGRLDILKNADSLELAELLKQDWLIRKGATTTDRANLLREVGGILTQRKDTRLVEPISAWIGIDQFVPDYVWKILLVLDTSESVQPLLRLWEKKQAGGEWDANKLESELLATNSAREKVIHHYEEALTSPDERVRLRSCDKLKQHHRRDTVVVLVSALSDSNWQVRSAAATLLKEMGWQPSNLNERVCYAFAKEEWDLVVREGTEGFGALWAMWEKIEGQKPNAGLWDRFSDGGIGFLRTIREVGDMRALVFLISFLRELSQSDESRSTTADAKDALSRMGPPAAMRLVECLSGGRNVWFADNTAVELLIKMGCAETVEPLLKKMVSGGYVAPYAARALAGMLKGALQQISLSTLQSISSLPEKIPFRSDLSLEEAWDAREDRRASPCISEQEVRSIKALAMEELLRRG